MKYKKRKNKKNKRIIIDITLVLVLVVLAGFLLFFSELFKVKHIRITVDDLYLRKEAGNYLISSLGHNLLLVNTDKIEQDMLSQYPEIEELKVKKRLLSSLSVDIKQRNALAHICFQDCYLIDKSNTIFADPDQNPEISIYVNYPVKEIGMDEQVLSEILKISDFIESYKFVLSGSNLDVETAESWHIYLDLSMDIDLALVKLNLLLDEIKETKNLEYIDLRFSKAYYK